jgi:transposase InsO family protein
MIKINHLCKAARVSRSGYYYYLNHKDERTKKDAPAVKIIKEFHKKSREKAGIAMIDMMIRNSSHSPINHKKIARIKREYGIVTKIRRKNPYKIFPTSENANVPNVLNRNFIAPLPDQIYSTDMTYLFYGKNGKAYMSATKDLATNEIVSHQLMTKPTLGHFTKEFRKLIGSLPKGAKKSLIIHSDQGFQYTHEGFRDLLRQHGVTQSMSRRGNCLDNAPIESFFGHFKDLLDLENCHSFEELEREIETTINYYNKERPQKCLNKKPPAVCRGLLSLF